MSRQANRTAPDPTAELLTDPEGATLLNLGTTRFLELQREPDFPPPIWLGLRGKRHVRHELLNWALSKRTPKRPGR